MKKLNKKMVKVKTPTEDIENAPEGIVEPTEKPQDNYRECTCGNLVPLPDGSAEEFTICECGIKHIR